MPAIVTHHLFGEESSALLPAPILQGQEDLLAFLLGNQGPDPLWARFAGTPGAVRSCHELASRMHGDLMTPAFSALREAVTHLHEADKTCGRAFVLGLLAHYLLDSTAHPLVYAAQRELMEADPSLACEADGVHALLEAEIDTWLLWQMRSQTVLEAPCSDALAHTERIDRIAGALLSQVAWEVYDIDLGAAEYGKAVRDYQTFYRLLDPPHGGTVLPRGLVRSRLARSGGWDVYAHGVHVVDACAPANLDHRLWRDPVSGVTSRASLPDLFHDALAAWPAFARSFIEGDTARFDAMVGGVNYYGVTVR